MRLRRLLDDRTDNLKIKENAKLNNIRVIGATVLWESNQTFTLVLLQTQTSKLLKSAFFVAHRHLHNSLG